MENEDKTGNGHYVCARLGKNADPEEPRCPDPRAYCKSRTACPIHMMEKELARARRVTSRNP